MILEAKKLPQYKEIKNLETISKKDGSGVRSEDLIGTWKFNSVWKKGSEEIDSISSSILQVLTAKLELKKNNFQNNNVDFKIKNSIRFGILSKNKGSLVSKDAARRTNAEFFAPLTFISPDKEQFPLTWRYGVIIFFDIDAKLCMKYMKSYSPLY